MPAYTYRCTACRTQDIRIAALDDHTALCTHCGAVMLRPNEDIFAPYFAGGAGFPACTPLIPFPPVGRASRPFRGEGGG